MSELGFSVKSIRAMEVFKKHFEPALEPLTADMTLTTREVFDKFKDLSHDPKFTINMMQDLLEQNGFYYDVWLGEFIWPINNIRR